MPEDTPDFCETSDNLRMNIAPTHEHRADPPGESEATYVFRDGNGGPQRGRVVD